MPVLAEWDSFYVIIGSAAGALIGLQFVVMTLLAARPPARGAEAGAAFATPTIVHFSVVLFLSALLRAPWGGIAAVAVVCGLMGLAGIGYISVTAWRMRAQSTYEPDFEDWLFHILLPLAAYGICASSVLAIFSHTGTAMFAVGGAALLLLFSGIHNAWDAVAYHVLVNLNRPDADKGR